MLVRRVRSGSHPLIGAPMYAGEFFEKGSAKLKPARKRILIFPGPS
jgi:hypothetical protein